MQYENNPVEVPQSKDSLMRGFTPYPIFGKP